MRENAANFDNHFKLHGNQRIAFRTQAMSLRQCCMQANNRWDTISELLEHVGNKLCISQREWAMYVHTAKSYILDDTEMCDHPCHCKQPIWSYIRFFHLNEYQQDGAGLSFREELVFSRIILLLLEAGADPSVRFNGYTPLLHCFWAGNAGMTKQLIRHGVDTNIMVQSLWNESIGCFQPFHFLCVWDGMTRLGITVYQLCTGSCFMQDDWVYEECKQVVVDLLDHGACTNARCGEHHTVMSMLHFYCTTLDDVSRPPRHQDDIDKYNTSGCRQNVLRDLWEMFVSKSCDPEGCHHVCCWA